MSYHSTCPLLVRLAALAALTVVAGCASRDNPAIPYATSELSPPDPVQAIDVTEQYRLGPGDTISVRVYRAAELSGDHQIDEQGNIDVPLVGRTMALGATPSQLADTLEQALGQTYYENPQVDVTVKEALGRRVTIDGSVRTPGVYPVDSSITLLRAISLAQGTTEYADTRRVAVFRTINGRRHAAAFDLHAIREGRAPDPAIYGSDIIVVDGNNLRLALRDVLQALPILAIFQPL